MPSPEDSVSGVLGEVGEIGYGSDVWVCIPVCQGTDDVEGRNGDTDDDETYSCVCGTNIKLVVADSEIAIV